MRTRSVGFGYNSPKSLSVSILVVNHRVYSELRSALASLEPFLGPDDEVIVFDQASDEKQLARLRSASPRVTAIACQENIGFAAGVNAAARMATKPHLLVLNPDVIVEGPVVQTLSQWLTEHPETGVVGPRVLDPDGTVQASARRFPGPTTFVAGRSTWLTRYRPNNWLSRRNLPGRTASSPIDVDWLAGSCFMTRRDLFERLGGLDESFFLYWEDADFCHRARALGFTCTYVPEVAVRHTVGRSTRQEPVQAIRAFHASAYHLYWKHSGPLGRLLAPVVRASLGARQAILVRRVVDGANAFDHATLHPHRVSDNSPAFRVIS